MSRTCPYCGKALEDGARFCKHCGRKVDGMPAGNATSASSARIVHPNVTPSKQTSRYPHALEKGRTRTYDAGSSSVVISRDNIQVRTTERSIIVTDKTGYEVIPMRSVTAVGLGAANKYIGIARMLIIFGVIAVVVALCVASREVSQVGLLGVLLVIVGAVLIAMGNRASVYVENGCSKHFLPVVFKDTAEAEEIVRTIADTSNAVKAE
ncbi:zinc-ribbon domain-containing protein [Olsenella sp. KH3B4]|nr:zinc-ribbon domain-containing protein [Olsenella sp. KH3B4]